MEEKRELIIDPEFAGQIPPLDPDEYEQLEENILKDGELLSPIVTWNGIIVDGHNRYKIIQDHPERNIQYKVREKDFPDRYSVLAWICKNQLGQRNLSDEQKRYLIGQQYEAEKHLHAGGQRGNKNAAKRLAQSEPIDSQEESSANTSKSTAERIAKEHGVSRETVKRAGKYAKGVNLAEETVPGTREEILSGKINPTSDEIVEILKTEDQEERKELVEGFRDDKETRRKKKEEAVSVIAEDDEEDAETEICSDPHVGEDELIREFEFALDRMMADWELSVDMNEEAARGESYCDRLHEVVIHARSLMDDFEEEAERGYFYEEDD